MSVCAIICEYNPLHRGHLWQIRQAKQRFDAVVCIMSGSFVQRGEPAIMDKFTDVYKRQSLFLTYPSVCRQILP